MLCALLGSLLAAAPAAAAPPFWSHWDDGKAEIDGYRLTQPRYGQARKGHAVMIWVTEPFSRSKHVKLDDWQRAGADNVPVLKLNQVRKFQTGIYDYSLMTSVFSPVVLGEAPAAERTPLKVAFTAQEWCGTVFQQLTRVGSQLQAQWYSYFEAEGDGSLRLQATPDLVLDDETWVRVRELMGAVFAAGRYRFLPALASVRLSHVPMVPGTLTVKRGTFGTTKVPAGAFETEAFELDLAWGPDARQHQQRTLWVERAWPHRIIAWEGQAPGFKGNEPGVERGELTGSMRTTYWEQQREGDERLLQQLGL
jgi:hypothetical protein